jgi:two-component system, LytTR family, response regulator
MITAVLIDDEKNALEVLEMQLTMYCPLVKIIASCNSGESGIQAILTHKPDLVFLDIEMPHKNGFDVIQETKGLEYSVIFTTAYDQFAIKAFKFSAVDYLLKPIDILELKAAVSRVSEKRNKTPIDDQLRQLLEKLNPTVVKSASKVALSLSDGMQLVDPIEIVRCESDSNYTHVFMKSGKKITVAKTLKDVEESLDNLGFFRIHQSHLVNMKYIDKVVKSDGGYIVLNDGTELAISRNRKDAFFDTFRKL